MRPDRMQVLAVGAGMLFLAGAAGLALAQAGGEISDLAFAAVDTSGDGFISEAEIAADQAKRFNALDTNRDRLLSPEELADHEPAAFRRVDKNGDAKLSFAEVMNNKLADFAKADTNGDGRLAMQEVVTFAAGRK